MPSRPQPSPYPPFRQDAQAPGHGAATDRLPPPPKPFQPAPSARGGPPTHAAAEPPPPPPFGAPGQQHAPAHAEGQPVRPAPRTAPPAGDGHESDARQRRPGVTSFGQLVENIPRAMRIAVPAVVEARIARAEVASVAQGLSGSGAVWRHDLTITKAMSVRLRAPDGGFFIETSSPETQWIENVHGLMTDDYASWRWTVTPRTSGRKRLQLIISARTVGTDGLTAETALPDQVVEIKVRTNYRIVAKRVAGWAAAAVVGGVLARFGEGVPEIVSQLVAAVVR